MNTANNSARIHTGSDSELTEVQSITVAHGAIGDIAADTTGGAPLVVANYGDDSISLVNTETVTVDWTVDVGGEPLAVAVADNRVYVGTASASYDCVAVVDTDSASVIATYPLELTIRDIAVSPDGKRVFVTRTSRSTSDVAVIDITADEVSTIAIPTRAAMTVDAVRVSPCGQRLHVAMSDTYAGNVVVVETDTARVVDTVPLLAPIRDLALSPDGDFAYVLSCDPRRGGAVVTVNLKSRRIASAVEVGGFPSQLVLSADGTRAYIVDRQQIAAMCMVTNEIIETVPVGTQPSCVALMPAAAMLYVADCGGGVTTFSVEPAVTLPKFQEMALGVIGASEVRELEPAV
ncbi:MAG: YncE family protein [Mycobacteriaceae bacterium]|nr:YncE family protein [Mycobacteriaceae bacterium]